jgi:two-component system response regulator AtoC
MMLIVDDDPTFLEQAESTLTPHTDKSIFFARDAEHAMQLLGLVQFSVALIDLNLDRENGFELISRVKKFAPALPVIAISGACDADVLQSARVFGAVDVLSKPINNAWLYAITRARTKADTALPA